MSQLWREMFYLNTDIWQKKWGQDRLMGHYHPVYEQMLHQNSSWNLASTPRLSKMWQGAKLS